MLKILRAAGPTAVRRTNPLFGLAVLASLIGFAGLGRVTFGHSASYLATVERSEGPVAAELEQARTVGAAGNPDDAPVSASSELPEDPAAPAFAASGTAPSPAFVAALAAPTTTTKPKSEVATHALSNSTQQLWLPESDVGRYQRIFSLQQAGDWAAADLEIERLQDRRLLGHILLQRYLHPSAYQVSYDELRGWLKSYGDHAGTERIYGLATRRQPPGEPPPPAPADIERLNGALEARAVWRGSGVVPRDRLTHRSDSPLVGRVDSLLRAGKPGAALTMLANDDQSSRLDDITYDGLRSRIATALFYDGSVRTAFTLASASASRSGDRLPESHWLSGLAAWRLGLPERSARHFAAMAADQTLSPWQMSAAAFWAGRAFDRLARTEEARQWYTKAARFPRTFYGLIAGRRIGRDPAFHWQVPTLTEHHLSVLGATAAGYRAIGLLQVGQNDLAEQELRRVHPKDNIILAEALVALADAAGLPALALQVGNAVAAPGGVTYDACLYPLPHWRPRDGFVVDRSLLFAIMRQESRFDPRSVSSAGATGVMQLMPETATQVGDGEDFQGIDRVRLFDPELNLALAQRYIARLLASNDIENNLLLLATAYNGGPSNLSRWRRELAAPDDPLLFIESIPYSETRDFIEKVLTNFWIYRMRLGQGTNSLDALAVGHWPIYLARDLVQQTQVADHGGEN